MGRGRCRYNFWTGKQFADPISNLPTATIFVIFFLVSSSLVSNLFLSELLTPPRIALLTLFLAVTPFDIKFQLIPNKFLVIGILIYICGMAFGIFPFLESLKSAFVILLTMLFIRWAGVKLFERPGIGMGDIKLLAVAALFVGWDVFWIGYLGFIAGGIIATSGLLGSYLNRDSRLPMAPFLLVGAYLVFIVEPSHIFFG